MHGIVHQWQGCVAVQSAVGKGTTFSVYLPRLRAERDAMPAIEDRPTRGTETVLIVEDEEMVRVMMQRMMRSAGYDVLAVDNGDEALLLLNHHDQRIDLLLTDVVLPRISGPELVEQVSLMHPGLAVLYMSGHTDNPALLESVRSAELRLIMKPFSGAELTRIVRLALDERRATQPS